MVDEGKCGLSNNQSLNIIHFFDISTKYHLKSVFYVLNLLLLPCWQKKLVASELNRAEACFPGVELLLSVSRFHFTTPQLKTNYENKKRPNLSHGPVLLLDPERAACPESVSKQLQ
jgi:hypothetical protein